MADKMALAAARLFLLDCPAPSKTIRISAVEVAEVLVPLMVAVVLAEAEVARAEAMAELAVITLLPAALAVGRVRLEQMALSGRPVESSNLVAAAVAVESCPALAALAHLTSPRPATCMGVAVGQVVAGVTLAPEVVGAVALAAVLAMLAKTVTPHLAAPMVAAAVAVTAHRVALGTCEVAALAVFALPLMATPQPLL
jgi:hypothetical protein